MSTIRKNRPRWEGMDKNDIPISSLVDQYLITCRTEGKTLATRRGYHEKLRRLKSSPGSSSGARTQSRPTSRLKWPARISATCSWLPSTRDTPSTQAGRCPCPRLRPGSPDISSLVGAGTVHQGEGPRPAYNAQCGHGDPLDKSSPANYARADPSALSISSRFAPPPWTPAPVRSSNLRKNRSEKPARKAMTTYDPMF